MRSCFLLMTLLLLFRVVQFAPLFWDNKQMCIYPWELYLSCSLISTLFTCISFAYLIATIVNIFLLTEISEHILDFQFQKQKVEQKESSNSKYFYGLLLLVNSEVAYNKYRYFREISNNSQLHKINFVTILRKINKYSSIPSRHKAIGIKFSQKCNWVDTVNLSSKFATKFCYWIRNDYCFVPERIAIK